MNSLAGSPLCSLPNLRWHLTHVCNCVITACLRTIGKWQRCDRNDRFMRLQPPHIRLLQKWNEWNSPVFYLHSCTPAAAKGPNKPFWTHGEPSWAQRVSPKAKEAAELRPLVLLSSLSCGKSCVHCECGVPSAEGTHNSTAGNGSGIAGTGHCLKNASRVTREEKGINLSLHPKRLDTFF